VTGRADFADCVPIDSVANLQIFSLARGAPFDYVNARRQPAAFR
jgi:hypothetical protein